MNAKIGIMIYGAEANDHVGKVMTFARSVNPGHCDDVILGMPQASYSSKANAAK